MTLYGIVYSIVCGCGLDDVWSGVVRCGMDDVWCGVGDVWHRMVLYTV